MKQIGKMFTSLNRTRLRKMPVSGTFAAILAACAFSGVASADEITFGGRVTQSTQDGTGPAMNNPSLNGIEDGDIYSVTLDFPGALTSPGAFNRLAGATLQFLDAAAGVSETSFDSVSLTVSPAGSFADISLLGCLSTGSACDQGNELDANFQIPAVQLNAKNWTPQPVTGLLPLDLLEDDGTTDIQGSVSAVSAVPEPAQIWMLGAATSAVLWRVRRRRLQSSKHSTHKEDKRS